MEKIAFIGCGNMGGAIARAVCRTFDPAKVILANRTLNKARDLAAELGCRVDRSNASAAACADIVFLGVKPHQICTVLDEIAPSLTGEELIVSMAAGVAGADMEPHLPKGNPIVRILPNTPCSIGRGLVFTVPCRGVSERQLKLLEALLLPCGQVGRCEEAYAEAAMTVGGCTPAFTYMFIEALADGGVRAGLKRSDALAWAAAAVEGAAAMVTASGSHPGALKDAVCSPGGATIEGVAALERGCFRSAAAEAIVAAAKRSAELG